MQHNLQAGIPWLLFSVEGRITRAGFWLGTLLTWGVSLGILLGVSLGIFLVGCLLWFATHEAVGLIVDLLVSFIVVIVGLAGTAGLVFFFWAAVAINTKRLHDHNLSGWWQLVFLIPAVGPLGAIIVLGMIPGKPTANDFGKVF